MKLIGQLLEHLGWVLAAFFGFLAGLIGLLVGQFFDGYFWPAAIGVAAICGIICLIFSSADRFFDRLFDNALTQIFSGFKSKTVRPRHLEKREAERRYVSWIAFLVGVVVAFIAGSIVSPAEIVGYF